MEIARTAAVLVEALSSSSPDSAVDALLRICRCSHVAHKFGQLLASRVDLFGSTRCERIRGELARSTPHVWSHAAQVLRALLQSDDRAALLAGAPRYVTDALAQVTALTARPTSCHVEQPWLPSESRGVTLLGVGAMAQVYGFGALAVKILHPGLHAELRTWRRVVSAAGLALTCSGFRNLSRTLHDLLGVIERQMNLTQELAALRLAAADLQDLSEPSFLIPEGFCATDELLLMQRVDFVPLTHPCLTHAERTALLHRALIYRDFLLQPQSRVLHADLHLDNLGAAAHDATRLVIVDFGATVTGQDLGRVRDIVGAISSGDATRTVALLRAALEAEASPSVLDHIFALLTNAEIIQQGAASCTLAQHILEVARQAQLLGVYLPSFLVETVIATNHLLVFDALLAAAVGERSAASEEAQPSQRAD